MSQKQYNVNNKIYFFLLVGLFVGISLFVASISSEELLTLIGVQNAYMLLFVLAAIGGMSTFTGVPYHFVLMSFASGGLNPIALGIATAAGVMIGDTTSYLLGRQGNQFLPKRFVKPLTRISQFLSNRPHLVTPLLVLYGSVSPFSNDFIVVSMGMMRYSYIRVIVPLAIGNLIFNSGLAFLGYYAFDSIQKLF